MAYVEFEQIKDGKFASLVTLLDKNKESCNKRGGVILYIIIFKPYY
jgi:hypothetical protein